MYNLLLERAEKFENDPEVKALRQRAKVDQVGVSTLSSGETAGSLSAAPDAAKFDPESYFNAKGAGFVQLNQIAVEHLMGAR
jgi:xylose isomerase